jgi:signal transduction histidine kinase/CheY-like chemotaxis protein
MSERRETALPPQQQPAEALTAEEITHTAIFNGIGDVMYVADPESYELLLVNAAFEAHWGEDWRGKKCYRVLQGRDTPCPFCTNDKILGDNLGKVYTWEFQNELSKQWFRCVDRAIPWTDGRMVRFELASDITELKETDQQLRAHKGELEQLVEARTLELHHKSRVSHAVNRIFRESLACETEEATAKVALSIAEEITAAKFGFIGEINAEGRFDTIGLSNPGWDVCEMPGGQATVLIKDMVLRGIWAKVLQTGRPRIANDPSSEPDRVGIPPGHPPLNAFMGVPLMRQDRVVGMIALGNKEGGFTDADVGAIEALSAAFYEVLLRKRMELEVRRQAWIKSGRGALTEQLAGEHSQVDLARRIITQLCRWMEVPTGVLYLPEGDELLRVAGYADRAPGGERIGLGEGLVGQAALSRHEVSLTDVAAERFTVPSGLGAIVPSCVYAIPIVQDGRVSAVLELGTLEPLPPEHRDFLESVSEPITLALHQAQSRQRQAALLEHTQQQAAELAAQQEELNAANEELEEHNQRLRESEERLRAQQEELQVTNEELEEKTELLERQKSELERGRAHLTQQARELAEASRYKSEFLSNMSHELRTPLNSLLLLSRALADNKHGNLTAEQVESAQVIHQGGNELLALINEILDLAKIEAGRMDLQLERLDLDDLAQAVRRSFAHVAEDKGLSFDVSHADDAPVTVTSDRQRLLQVLRNLVGNAIKFTDVGSVTVIFRAPTATELTDGADGGLAIDVVDTGIGIAKEQRRLVFEAFQQADGGIRRRHGGTGLGLSISRELSELLGGQLTLSSELGRGSTFTLLLPAQLDAPDRAYESRSTRNTRDSGDTRSAKQMASRSAPVAAPIPDDRHEVDPGDRCMLLIEDDGRFSKQLASSCHERGLKVLAAASGEEGLALARRHRPLGIILDVGLPGINGWQVLEQLKEDPDTRHIPVHVISGAAPSPQALRRGAVGYLQKPVAAEQIRDALSKVEDVATRTDKRVLVVEDDERERRAIAKLVEDEHVTVDQAIDGEAALTALRAEHYDCVILDLGLGDLDGNELLVQATADDSIALPPVIVYTGRNLSWEESIELRGFSDAVIIKDVRSDERLLDEVSLFLHRVVAEMPESKRQLITNLHDSDALLRGKRALIVDDDMRALFALSRLLAERGMDVLKAENGERAIELLGDRDDVDVVLMDIMMPVLDGYATMERIRANERHRQLPIIALTAKAMKGDQKRCLEAGASDYLSKPVDQDRLVSMLRVWLYR